MSEDRDYGAEAEVVADLAARAAEPFVVDPANMLVTTHEHHRVLDLERFLPAPRRKAGEYRLATVDAFADYVTEHYSAHCTIWIDRTARKVTAVLNDHAGSGPAWRDHRAVLALEVTPEWAHWRSQDGKLLDQEAFAEHVQNGVDEIRRPDGATMLEIAQTLQGSTNATWKSARRLDSGEVAFEYVEQVEATAGRKAHLEIPHTFDLAVSPFYGEDPASVSARLRHRTGQGTLRIGYQLVRPEDAVTRVLEGIAGRLEAAAFSQVYLGAPPS